MQVQIFGWKINWYLTRGLGPPPLLLGGRGRRGRGLLVAQLEVGAHLVVDVALRSDDVPLAVGSRGSRSGVRLVEDGAGAAGRANHPAMGIRRTFYEYWALVSCGYHFLISLDLSNKSVFASSTLAGAVPNCV